jgi:hypothetical protein
MQALSFDRHLTAISQLGGHHQIMGGGAPLHSLGFGYTLRFSCVWHCYIVLDSASMTVVYPFHAFMHKPCDTANILTLHQISQT